MTPPRPDAAARAAQQEREAQVRLAEVTAELLARAPENDIGPSLERIQALMGLLGEPQRAYPVIHLTGTNGKTSTARMIDTILAEMGLSAGRFTSPHLSDIRERISIGGEPISTERFLAAYDDVAPLAAIIDERSLGAGGRRLTFFEMLTAIAYAAFADAPVDVAVVEVGLGGAWDATNVADGQVCVVTPIDLDHTDLLGDTVEDIAREKAGIITAGATAVIGVQADEAAEVLRERIGDVEATGLWEGRDFGVVRREVAVGGQQVTLRGTTGEHEPVLLPLHGEHQARNLACAVAAVESFVGGGEQGLSEEVLAAAAGAMTSPGRLEVVRRSPTILVDAAHNPAGASVLATALEEAFTFTRLVAVVAVMADKDAEGLLVALDRVVDAVVVTRNSSPRSMPTQRLAGYATDILGEHRVSVVESLPDALETAAGLAEADGLGGGVLATGSVVTAADVRRLLGVDG